MGGIVCVCNRSALKNTYGENLNGESLYAATIQPHFKYT